MKEIERYNGEELIKALKYNEIPYGTKLYIEHSNGGYPSYKFYTIVGEYRDLHIWREEEGKEDVMLDRTVGTEDLINNVFIMYDTDEEYSLKNSINILDEFLEQLEKVFQESKINNTKERKAIKKVLNVLNNSVVISRNKLELLLDAIEKQNKPYEDYNTESRAYWLNEGKKSLINMLLGGLGEK